MAPPPAAGVPQTGPALSPRGGYRYQRRRPDQTALYQVVRDHLETFYAAVQEGFVSAPLPAFVRAELDAAASHPRASQKLQSAATKAAARVRRKGSLPFKTTDVAIMMLLPDAYRYVGVLPWES